MTSPRPRRSFLYLPAANGRMLAKARTLSCDGLILDLEDAVAPEAKEAARGAAAAAVAAGGFPGRETIIRINPLAGPWGAADLEAAAAARPDGIALPKVAAPDDLAAAARRLDAVDPDGRIALWAMIETPAAILALREIAGAGGRLAGLVIGSNDLAKETGVRGRAPLLPWLMTAVAAAHANGLALLDGVFNDFGDADGFERECREARDMGFSGKTLIHPGQIDAANRVFAPDAAEIALARRVVALFDDPLNAGRGVLAIDGRMVERLHAEAARRLLALADAVAERG